ncbi:MAG: hypothetical protein D6758_11080 [Gammaproteobacteria bacterium]|nr:MAG: hypothetical protein D6758_11080 [Gammaproteobacteria bacterium]
MTHTLQLDTEAVPHLAELFRALLSGRHINRAAEPELWAELEQHQERLIRLFGALGFDLRVDGRGFCWFHTEAASSTLNKTSRQFALLFMIIFDFQADAGLSLHDFQRWRIGPPLLEEIDGKYRDLLSAEELDTQALASLMDRAERLGFVRKDQHGWRLLPAVSRYLDHFQALARSGASAPGLMDDADPGEEEGE